MNVKHLPLGLILIKSIINVFTPPFSLVNSIPWDCLQLAPRKGAFASNSEYTGQPPLGASSVLFCTQPLVLSELVFACL